MKFNLHVIGVALSAMLVVLAAWGAMWPASVPVGMTEADLLTQLQAVRQERNVLGAKWESTVEAMTQMSIRPDAPAAVAIASPRPRGRATIKLPETGPWSAREAAARAERRAWIDNELRKRATASQE